MQTIISSGRHPPLFALFLIRFTKEGQPSTPTWTRLQACVHVLICSLMWAGVHVCVRVCVHLLLKSLTTDFGLWQTMRNESFHLKSNTRNEKTMVPVVIFSRVWQIGCLKEWAVVKVRVSVSLASFFFFFFFFCKVAQALSDSCASPWAQYLSRWLWKECAGTFWKESPWKSPLPLVSTQGGSTSVHSGQGSEHAYLCEASAYLLK